jgi:hypothetical protein
MASPILRSAFSGIRPPSISRSAANGSSSLQAHYFPSHALPRWDHREVTIGQKGGGARKSRSISPLYTRASPMGPGRVLPMRKAGLGQLLAAGQALIGWDRSGRWLRHRFNHFCQNQPSVSRRSEFSAMHRVAFGLDHFAFGDLPTFRWCKQGHSSSICSRGQCLSGRNRGYFPVAPPALSNAPRGSTMPGVWRCRRLADQQCRNGAGEAHQ